MITGRDVLGALQRQGYGVVDYGLSVYVMTPDGRHSHEFPRATFHEDDKVNRVALRIVVTGLEVLTGFTAPEGFWQD